MLSRKLIDSEIFNKPDKWLKIFLFLLIEASHKDHGTLKRGQCFMTYETIRLTCRATKSVIDHGIRWMKSKGMLGTQKVTGGMIVTIVKYNTYQNTGVYKGDGNGDTEGIQKGYRRDTEGTTYNKNGRMEERKNGKTEKRKNFRPNSDEFVLSELLLNLILERKPDYKKPNLQKWAGHIDKMIRLDNRKPDRIREIIIWCQADSGDGKWAGWQDNILSTAKLREKFDTLELKKNENGRGTTDRRDFGNQTSQYGIRIEV